MNFIQLKIDSCVSLSQLLEFLVDFYTWKVHLFSDNEQFSRDLNAWLEKIINSGSKIESTYFAKNLNQFLVIGNSDKVEICLKLLRVLVEKDKYIKAIYKHFTQAILGKRYSEGYIMVYNELRTQYGDETVKNFKNLVHDIQESKVFMEEVGGQISEKIEDMFIVGKGHWPGQNNDWKVPDQLLEHELSYSVKRIKSNFLKNSDLKKLEFMTDYSVVEIEVQLAGRQTLKKMKLKYALIFLAFNDRENWDFSALSEFLDVQESYLRSLIKKMNIKFRVFHETETSLSLKNESVFFREGEQELKEDKKSKQLEQDQEFQRPTGVLANKEDVLKEMDRSIRAFIVREVKMAKKINFMSLVDLVSEKFRVAVTSGDLSGIVEDLLSNDFIQRNKEDENMFEFK